MKMIIADDGRLSCKVCGHKILKGMKYYIQGLGRNNYGSQICFRICMFCISRLASEITEDELNKWATTLVVREL